MLPVFLALRAIPSSLVLTVSWLRWGPEAGGTPLDDSVTGQVGKQGDRVQKLTNICRAQDVKRQASWWVPLFFLYILFSFILLNICL